MEAIECTCGHCGHAFRAAPEAKHRLLCGDSTKPDDVNRLLGDVQPFLMVTDPPYGVNYDPTFRSDNRTGTVTNDDRASWNEAYQLFPGAVAYVWHGNLHVVTVAADLLHAGFELRSYLVWKPTRRFPISSANLITLLFPTANMRQ